MSNFTSKQIENWRLFREIQETGLMNMCDSKQGSELTGMGTDEWKFCMKNYSELQEQAEADDA